VSEPWSPPLQVRRHGPNCRLSLGGVAHGDGKTLQDAADDLVHRLLTLALCTRNGRLSFSRELVPDTRLLEFLWELGEIAARGDDIRPRLFDSPSASPSLD
jgi:hypothetical protein